MENLRPWPLYFYSEYNVRFVYVYCKAYIVCFSWSRLTTFLWKFQEKGTNNERRLAKNYRILV